jgi:hypothetical protein
MRALWPTLVGPNSFGRAAFQAIHRLRMHRPPREQVRSYRSNAHASPGRTEFIREDCLSGDTQAANVPSPREHVRSYRPASMRRPGRTEFIREGVICPSADLLGKCGSRLKPLLRGDIAFPDKIRSHGALHCCYTQHSLTHKKAPLVDKEGFLSTSDYSPRYMQPLVHVS